MDWGCGSKLQRDKPWIRFISAIFLSLTIMTSVGYGVLHAVNTMKMIFIIFYMLINLGYRSLLAWLLFSLETDAFSVLLAITFLRSRLRLSLQTGIAAHVLLLGFVFLWFYLCCSLFSCETVWRCSSVSIVGWWVYLLWLPLHNAMAMLLLTLETFNFVVLLLFAGL